MNLESKAHKEHVNVENVLLIAPVWGSFLWFCFFFFFFVRWKVLELSLWLVMLGLTACLTSWSTSLSTTASASTSSVLVSLSFLIFLFWLYYYCRNSYVFRYLHKTQITLAAFSFLNHFSSAGCRKYHQSAGHFSFKLLFCCCLLQLSQDLLPQLVFSCFVI